MNLKPKYKYLKMVVDEGVESYIHRVNDLVDSINGVGRKIKEGDVVRKIFLTLPRPYKTKRCVID